MFHSRALAWAAVAMGGVAVHAQEGQPVLVEMRVVSVATRRATVDRGALDGLLVGDRVVFRLRDGGERTGRVIAVEERSAQVEPTDANFVALAGMRVEARLPADRFELVEEVVEDGAALAAPVASPPAETGAPAEHAPWERPDDGWTAEMPLLAKVRPFRPEERDPAWYGRVWTSADIGANSEGDRSDAYFRAGADATLENAFGLGGRLSLDGEWNYRDVDVPDGDGESGSRFLLERASYAWGGDRFARDRFEVGRFLHSAFPEFGVLDGFEWDRRLPGGGSFGTSIGFLPEWDTLSEEGDDQELAAWYRWASDESEELTLGAGYQKTFHDFDADRDLVVLKAAWLPPHAWTAQFTAWIDVYGSGDEAKGSGVDVTQAWFTTGRSWSGGSSVDIAFRHLAFAETDRDEFLPVTQAQLADDRYDRASISARQMFDVVGIREEFGVWSDEDEEGGDGELTFEVHDMLFDGSRVEAAGFGTQGRFTTLAGWRASLGGGAAQVAWNLGYEFVLNDQQGFSTDNDELPQHRASLDLDWNTPTGWSLALHGAYLIYDEEDGYTAGLYLQRSF